MTDNITLTKEDSLDPDFIALCKSIEAKRARTVINHILKHGIITNEELSDIYGYDHPPRAIRDVRESGIPLVTHKTTSQKTGRQIGAYTFDSIANVKHGRIGGRRAFSKNFKRELVELYGARDAVTGDSLDERYLQIDHRIPYEVGGDAASMEAGNFMLLDASSQRAKSWSCEHCANFATLHNPELCKTCFWAFPEEYQHIALEQKRRVDIVWSGNEIDHHDTLKSAASAAGVPISSYIKSLLSKK